MFSCGNIHRLGPAVFYFDGAKDVSDIRFERRDPKSLKNHLLSASIYGTQPPDKSFLDSLDEHEGIHTPLVILNDGTIIAGHRRRQGAIIKAYKEVPCIVRLDLEEKPLIVERMIISSNKDTRVRTDDILAREAAALADIESRAATLRQASTRSSPGEKIGATKVVAKSPPPINTGKTRQNVAKSLDIGEKKAAEAIVVGKAIKQAEDAGDKETAEKIVSVARDQSIHAAAALVSPPKSKPATTPQALDQFSKDIERDVYALSGTISKAKKTFAELFNAVDRKKDAHPVFAKERHRKFEKLLRTLFESLDATETHCKSLNLLWEDTKKLGMQ